MQSLELPHPTFNTPSVGLMYLCKWPHSSGYSPYLFKHERMNSLSNRRLRRANTHHSNDFLPRFWKKEFQYSAWMKSSRDFGNKLIFVCRFEASRGKMYKFLGFLNSAIHLPIVDIQARGGDTFDRLTVAINSTLFTIWPSSKFEVMSRGFVWKSTVSWLFIGEAVSCFSMIKWTKSFPLGKKTIL